MQGTYACTHTCPYIHAHTCSRGEAEDTITWEDFCASYAGNGAFLLPRVPILEELEELGELVEGDEKEEEEEEEDDDDDDIKRDIKQLSDGGQGAKGGPVAKGAKEGAKGGQTEKGGQGGKEGLTARKSFPKGMVSE